MKFFIEDIDNLLENYEPGKPDYKLDVTKQLAEIRVDREKKQIEHIKKQAEYKDTLNKLNMIMNHNSAQQQINDQSTIIQQLMLENNHLKEQNEYLNNKIKQLILSQIERKKT